MKRAVYDAVGRLDERFGLGFFDDDDLAERARRAGFELAVAHDLFVHHFGSRTFVGNGVDAEKLLDENAARFAVKWGSSVPRGRRVALRAWGNGGGIAVGEVGTLEPGSDTSGLHPRLNGVAAARLGTGDCLGGGIGLAFGRFRTPRRRLRISPSVQFLLKLKMPNFFEVFYLQGGQELD